MKNLVLAILAISFGIIACGNSNGKKSTDTNGEVPEKPIVVVKDAPSQANDKPIQMNKKMFLEEIMDYENNTTWVYKSDMPGIIDFYADWCRPCKIVAPIFEELAKEYAGKVKFYKVDTEAERELASAVGIQSLPTFLYMPVNGKPEIRQGIARTPEEIKKMFREQIESVLLKK